MCMGLFKEVYHSRQTLKKHSAVVLGFELGCYIISAFTFVEEQVEIRSSYDQFRACRELVCVAASAASLVHFHSFLKRSLNI